MRGYLWEKYSPKLSCIWRRKDPQTTQKRQFDGYSIATKHLNIYNLGTTNAIMMKLSTIMYLHETFHLA